MSTWLTGGRTLPWEQVDVFAENALEGNMLAIFPDARSLSDAEMQAIARETNLSETTFIFPEDPETEQRQGVRVRIFTVQEELPFAGHPTLGTASWLWANHPTLRGRDEVRLRLNVGTIPVRFTPPVPGEAGVFGEMRQRDPEFGPMADRASIAAACSLSPEDLHASLEPQAVSTGLPFCVVPLRSVEVLSRLHVLGAMAGLLERLGAKFIYAIARADDGTWRARMPFDGMDDPATGSAAGCAISYLVLNGAVDSSENTVISQGIEAHRPSRIFARASLDAGRITNVFVAGRTIPVAAGLFTLP